MAKSKKNKIKKPNYLLWFIYVLYSKLFLFFKYHLKINNKALKERNKKEGCIIIYNHCSNYDHYISSASLNFTHAHYVITKHFYFNKKLRFILSSVAAVPREQFKSDITSIKTIKKIIDSGGIISIAPSGQITVHGELTYVDKAIVKLLKFCKCDVYALQTHGNYLAFPKWHKVKRKFPISTEFVKVFDKENIKTLSDEELYDGVIKAIDINDRESQKTNHYVIKTKDLTKGLDNVLYYCPKCKSKYTLKADNNILYCEHCNNSIKMNKYGFLEPNSNDCVMFENETEWYHYQKEILKRKIKENSLHLEEEFLLKHNIKEEWVLEDVGTGKLILTNDEFYYDGTINGEHVIKKFNLDQMVQIPFDVAVRITIPDDDGTFQFHPINNKKVIMEYVQAIDAMHELKTENNSK